MLVVRADTRDPSFHAGGAGHEHERRTDFVLLRDRLGAQVVDLNDLASSRLARLVRRAAGTYAALAVAAFRQRRTASAYWTGSENEAIVLALLLRAARSTVPIVAVGQYPAKSQKSAAWRIARVHEQMHRVLPLGSVQAARLVNGLGVPADKVELLPLGIDTRYWHPERASPRTSPRRYVFAAGLQHRDYRTLVAAVEGLDVDLVIAANSPWSTTGNELAGEVLPARVTVEAPDLTRLRDSYAGAAVVVTSVVETDFPAGTTAVLEGMCMARPVVLARAEGTGDYVADRRSVLRAGPVRATAATYAGRYGSPSAQGQTGLYFAPGDVEELRSVLRWVLAHPEEAEEVGRRCRRVVEEVHTLEAYVEQMAAAVESAVAARPQT